MMYVVFNFAGGYDLTEIKEKKIRDFSWNDYGISIKRHMELKFFCEQYYEKKSRINYNLSSIQYTGMPKGNKIGNPTERMALENELYRKDCAIMEEAAIRANPSIYRYILKSVAADLPYEQIEYDEQTGKIPYGKTDFYGYRRLFFYFLHRLKIGDNLREVM